MAPLTVLTLCNQLCCESRRARVTMSAVDAKSLFFSDGNRLRTKVYDLREICRWNLSENKGQFFATVNKFYDESNNLETLLPFSESSSAGKRVFALIFDAENHSAFETWSVTHNANVEIIEAGIAAGKAETARIAMPVNCPEIPGHETFRDEFNLNDFLASFSPSQKKYAICLLRPRSRVNGLNIVYWQHT